MDFLKNLNNAVEYIEANLCDKIDPEKLSGIAFCPYDSFKRFFSYMANMTLNEYIRKRRLTLAAYEIKQTQSKIIDIALKYGYNSPDAFTNAFIKQHGVSPIIVRKTDTAIKAYPPISFHITVKGAEQMKFRIIDTESIVLRGISRNFTGNASERFEQEHIMWANHHDDIQSQVCEKVSGIWYGIWDRGSYTIAKRAEDIPLSKLNEIIIPQGKYAVFESEFGGFAGDVFPKLHNQVFDSWLDDSGYYQIKDYEVEIYYLYDKSEKQKRHYELWIPIAANHSKNN